MDVALRTSHLAASHLSQTEVVELIRELGSVASPVLREDRHGRMSDDPNDDMVLETAINGDANFIVTHNIKHLHGPATRFRIDVVTPRDFLDRLRRLE